MTDYAAVFEKTSTGWSAYCPDLPGLGVTGPTYEATEHLLSEGILFHLDGLRTDGDPIPDPPPASSASHPPPQLSEPGTNNRRFIRLDRR